MKAMRINKVQRLNNCASANIVRNICNYTCNVAPRTYMDAKAGRRIGEKVAKIKNHGSLMTCADKHLYAARSVLKGISPIEIPVILSALAIPTPVMFLSPVAFVAGGILISPIILKKIACGELSSDDIKKFFKNMKQKDFIPLDPFWKNILKRSKNDSM